MSIKYKLTYRLYSNDYSRVPEEYEVITENPWEYLERLKADLNMCACDVQLGSYVVEPINHLRLVKTEGMRES